MKITYTLKELTDEWLDTYPEDKNHPDLEQMVTAGMVILKCGSYIKPKHYDLILEEKRNEQQLPPGKPFAWK